MNNVSGNPAFIAAIEALMNMVRYSTMLIVPTFVGITLIVSLAKGFTSQRGVEVDYSPVVRGFILMVSLFFYAEILGLISGAIGGFAGFITQPDNIYSNLNILQSGVPAESEPKENSLTGYIGQAVEWLSSFNLHEMLQSFVLGGIASIARKLIDIFRQTLLGFLYVVGPIALSISVLPGFGKLLLKWFQNYLSVQLWSITLIILDNLVVLYTDLSRMRTSVMSGLSVDEASEKIDIILLNIAITVLYFMVPYLTSLFVGQTSSGSFQSKAIGLATAGAMLATKGGGAAVSKIAGSQVSQTQTAHHTTNNRQTAALSVSSQHIPVR
jgi:hypothetical protein